MCQGNPVPPACVWQADCPCGGWAVSVSMYLCTLQVGTGMHMGNGEGRAEPTKMRRKIRNTYFRLQPLRCNTDPHPHLGV